MLVVYVKPHAHSSEEGTMYRTRFFAILHVAYISRGTIIVK